jgi:hypothetical protein
MFMHAVGSDIEALGQEKPSLELRGPELVSKTGIPIPDDASN